MSKVEKSVLLLHSENPWATENLRKQAVECGINSSRLIFVSHLPRVDCLAQYAVAGLFLDTYPYNAGTTASDAPWMGVPVITLRVQSFPSRVASSLLINLNLPELIYQSIESYEAQAIDLAKNSASLNELKSKLAASRLTEPPSNTWPFTKYLGQAFNTTLCVIQKISYLQTWFKRRNTPLKWNF